MKEAENRARAALDAHVDAAIAQAVQSGITDEQALFEIGVQAANDYCLTTIERILGPNAAAFVKDSIIDERQDK